MAQSAGPGLVLFSSVECAIFYSATFTFVAIVRELEHKRNKIHSPVKVKGPLLVYTTHVRMGEQGGRGHIDSGKTEEHHCENHVPFFFKV